MSHTAAPNSVLQGVVMQGTASFATVQLRRLHTRACNTDKGQYLRRRCLLLHAASCTLLPLLLPPPLLLPEFAVLATVSKTIHTPLIAVEVGGGLDQVADAAAL